MAGLIRRRNLGTQPAPAAPSMRGRHNRGGGPRHMGGGGGGGNNRNRIPNAGLWHGRQGRAAANQNPEAFFRQVAGKLGGLAGTGAPIDQFSQDYGQILLDEYQTALATNQRLSPQKFLRQTHGAGFEGKKGRRFNPGQLTAEGDGAYDEAYGDWYSNTMTNDFVTGHLTGQGGYVPLGGNAEYQRFVQEQGVPGLLAEVAGAREADPHMSIADLIEGRDLAQQMRARFLARPDTMRQPAPVNLGGRWSWWE